MKRQRITPWTALSVLLLLAAGCSKAELPAAPGAPSVTRVRSEKLAPSDLRRQKQAAGAKQDESSAAATVFEPPYPNRLDLFRRPNTSTASFAPREQQPSGTSQVVLRGFVDVNGLHALLEIDQLTTALKAGEERSGVQVVEIAPPQVILQRGRVRWTERLYSTD